MSTLALTDFLLARVAEDEAAWRSDDAKYATHHPDCDSWGDMPGICDCNLRSRLLAECEAKRRIIAEHPHAYRPGDGRLVGEEWVCQGCINCWYWCPMLRLLALPYADHPDYRDEWRPNS